MSRVVHFEIHAGDPERAINFYEKLFGWTFQKWEGPMPYWLVITGPDDQRGINGGLIKRQGEIDGDRGDLQDEARHGAAAAGLDAQKIAAVRQPPEARRGQFGGAA